MAVKYSVIIFGFFLTNVNVTTWRKNKKKTVALGAASKKTTTQKRLKMDPQSVTKRTDLV